MDRNRQAASAAARARMAELRLNTAELARRSGLDASTVSDFLNDRRWPRSESRGSLEEVLGWPAGRIDDIAAGRADATVVPTDHGVLLDLPDSVLEGLSELQIREARADAEATFLRRVAEIKQRDGR